MMVNGHLTCFSSWVHCVALTEARKVKDDDFPKNFFKTEYLFDYYTGNNSVHISEKYFETRMGGILQWVCMSLLSSG